MEFLDKRRNQNLATLLIRLSLGLIFIGHGWQKINGIEGIIGFFGGLGLAPFFAHLVAWTELISGILMVLGLFVEIAAIGIAAVMVFAIYLVKFKAGFLGGYELDFILLFAALSIFFSSAGKYSLAGMMKKSSLPIGMGKT